jgi:hypothetical protein
MKLSAILQPLIDAKAPHDLIMAQILAFEAQQIDALAAAEAVIEEGRAKGRERFRKWKENHSNVSKREPTLANGSKRPVHVEDKTSNLETHKEEQKASRTHGDVAAFKAGLTPDVSEEVLSEFVKVRRKKRGALTAYAASLFREDAAKCEMTVAEAAKECVRSSWITVKPEYFQHRQRAGPPTGPQKPPQMADVFKLIKDTENGRQEREDRGGAGGGISYLPAVGSR